MTGSHGHMRDFEGHVKALESDLEYFRTKRLEPRVLLLARRGVVPLYDLLRTAGESEPDHSAYRDAPLEQRIRALEDRLDELVLGIATISGDVRTADLVIDDLRSERGDYDEFFRIAKRSHGGGLQQRVEQLERELSECLWLLDVLTRTLLARGEMTEEQLSRERELLQERGYRNGAQIVAKAWVDPDFKRRLVSTGREAVRELGIPPGRLGKLGVAENTEDTHNVVVCTLCSCYPHDLLGDPPWWYRTEEYRQRIVAEPREALRDMFGFDVSADVDVKVHDSTSDVRWMVLPARPLGTEGMTEEQLAELVTLESLVGVADALRPGDPVEQRRSQLIP